MEIPQDIWLLLSEYLPWRNFSLSSLEEPEIREPRIKMLTLDTLGEEAVWKLKMIVKIAENEATYLSLDEKIDAAKPITEKARRWVEEVSGVYLEKVEYEELDGLKLAIKFRFWSYGEVK